MPLLVVSLHTFRLIPYYGTDFTPIAFAVTGILLGWNIFQFRFFDLVPIARTVPIDSMEDLVVVLDKQNRVVDLNLAAEQMLGRSLPDILGCPAREVFSKWEEVIKDFREELSAQADIELDVQGEQHAYALTIAPIYDRRKRLAGRLCHLRDISSQKQAETALQEYQRQLEASYQREQERRRLSDTLREAVTIVSSTLEPRRVVGLLLDELQKVVLYHFASVMLVQDDQLTRLVRRSAKGDSYHPLTFSVDAYQLNAEALAQKLPILIADTRSDPRWKISSETHGVRSLLNTPLLVQDRPIGILFIGRTDEAAYTEEDSNIVFAFATHVAIALENARLAEQTQGTLVDLQDTLERLQRTQTRLVESEKMAALGQLIAGVAHEINTPLGAIRASIGNISATMDSSLTKLPYVLRQLSPSQQDRFVAFVERALHKRPQLTSREERKLRRTLQAELETYHIDNADHLADTLVDMGIHENISSFLPLFQSEESDKMLQAAYSLATQRHNSDNIVTAVERVSKIVFALKSYVQDDRSGDKSQADIHEGIETVLTLYHNQLKHGIEVVTHYENVPRLLCYPDAIKQIWNNLIHNAIQAMDGKGRLEISVERGYAPAEGSEYILVRISDSGCGIPDENKERIFEPFFTTKTSGEGSGLGLDMCQKIVEKHEGKIGVESQPGNTTFSVWLPVF